MPNEEIEKDEVKHSKFWRRKKWKDPCVEKFRKDFDKCNFGLYTYTRIHSIYEFVCELLDGSIFSVWS